MAGVLIMNGVKYHSTPNGVIREGEEVVREQQPILSFAKPNEKVATTIVPPTPPKEEKSWFQKLFGPKEKEVAELPHPNKRNELGWAQNFHPEVKDLIHDLGN